MVGYRARLVVASLACLVAGFWASTASAQDSPHPSKIDGLVEILDVTYTVLPEEGRVDVERRFTFKNLIPNQYNADGSYTYWTVSDYLIVAETEITDLVISVNGNPTGFTEEASESDSLFTLYSVELPYPLRYGNSFELTAEYSITNHGPDKPRKTLARRINGAFFEVDLVSCCFFEEITSRVVIPAEFTTSVLREFGGSEAPENEASFPPYIREFVDGMQVFTYTNNEITGAYTDQLYDVWSGNDDDGYAQTQVDVGDAAMTVVYAPDDQGWGARISSGVRDFVTELEQLTGEPWPAGADLVLRQSPDALDDDRNDAVGFHGPLEDQIDIHDSFSDKQLAYTLAGAWFKDLALTDRWIQEGYQLEFASTAYERSGRGSWDRRDPRGTRVLSPWIDSVPSYDRAHHVIDFLAEELGTDGLLELLDLIGTNETAFVGEGAPEPIKVPTDWQRFLDLVEQRLGVSDFGEVVSEHVIGPARIRILDRRNEAIASVGEVFGDDWTNDERGLDVPVGIRTALSEWELDEVAALVQGSADVLDHRRAVLERADQMNLAPDLSGVGPALARVNTPGGLEALDEWIGQFELGLDQIEAAEARRSESRGFVNELGLRGTDLDRLIAAARSSYDQGELMAVAAHTTALVAQVDDAPRVGQRRLLWTLVPALLVGAMLAVLALWWRRRRKAARIQAAVAAAEAEVRLEMTSPR